MTDPTLPPIRAISGQWDPNLSEVRVDGGLVRALKCGVFQPDLDDGDVYYKLIGAAFIDEEEARGRHIITVDVVDENFNRIQGARVWHGWPTHRFPDFDERVQLTIFGSQVAEWALYANFDAWTVPGPYWVSCADGKSDVLYGAGLPWNKHVCFAGMFQRTIYRAQPAGTFRERLLAEAERRQVIQFNPGAALQQRIFAAGFVPNSPEFEIDECIAQRAEHLDTGEVRIYYAPLANVNQVAFEVRPRDKRELSIGDDSMTSQFGYDTLEPIEALRFTATGNQHRVIRASNLRQEASTKAPVYALVNKDAIVNLISEDGDWWHVEFVGFIAKSQVGPSIDPPK